MGGQAVGGVDTDQPNHDLQPRARSPGITGLWRWGEKLILDDAWKGYLTQLVFALCRELLSKADGLVSHYQDVASRLVMAIFA